MKAVARFMVSSAAWRSTAAARDPELANRATASQSMGRRHARFRKADCTTTPPGYSYAHSVAGETAGCGSVSCFRGGENMATETLAGSCLCGSVRYTAIGEITRFYHCHCSRCRKATGTGHASNMFLKGSLSWESGEDQVASYKVPEAERFMNSFCKNCGSRVPRFVEKFGVVMIPAGSLDN